MSDTDHGYPCGGILEIGGLSGGRGGLEIEAILVRLQITGTTIPLPIIVIDQRVVSRDVR